MTDVIFPTDLHLPAPLDKFSLQNFRYGGQTVCSWNYLTSLGGCRPLSRHSRTGWIGLHFVLVASPKPVLPRSPIHSCPGPRIPGGRFYTVQIHSLRAFSQCPPGYSIRSPNPSLTFSSTRQHFGDATPAPRSRRPFQADVPHALLPACPSRRLQAHCRCHVISKCTFRPSLPPG